MSTIVFVGGGRITSAMLAGLRLARHDYRLLVHDRNLDKLQNLEKEYQVAVDSDLGNAVREADFLIVAVRPDSVRELLLAIDRVLKGRDSSRRQKTIAVSLAAGVPLRGLSGITGPALKWARAMPSPVCRSGQGLTALSFLRNITAIDRRFIHKFFSAFGQTIEIPESKLDAFTVTYSSSHGYHALATLAAAAQKIGLDRKTAMLASAHALADGILAWRNGDLSLGSLLEEAVTPGGIAAATTSAMEAAGFTRAVRLGLEAGLRRARANAGK